MVCGGLQELKRDSRGFIGSCRLGSQGITMGFRGLAGSDKSAPAGLGRAGGLHQPRIALRDVIVVGLLSGLRGGPAESALRKVRSGPPLSAPGRRSRAATPDRVRSHTSEWNRRRRPSRGAATETPLLRAPRPASPQSQGRKNRDLECARASNTSDKGRHLGKPQAAELNANARLLTRAGLLDLRAADEVHGLHAQRGAWERKLDMPQAAPPSRPSLILPLQLQASLARDPAPVYR